MMSKPSVNYTSCFDIIGPVMIGPSSSHTAGACAIGRAAYRLFKKIPDKVRITYYESFAATHQGHGTDFAIVSGLMGFAPDDDRVPEAIEIARKNGMEISFIESKDPSPVQHANTAFLELYDKSGNELKVTGASIGGGAIEIREIEKQGMIIKPNMTNHLVIFELSHPLELETLEEVLNSYKVEIENIQRVCLGNNELVLFNTRRELTDLEIEELCRQVDADDFMTMM